MLTPKATDAAITLPSNNAGLSLKGGLLDNGPAEVQRPIVLNITGPTLLAGAAAKACLTRRVGTIVNIASVLALTPEA